MRERDLFRHTNYYSARTATQQQFDAFQILLINLRHAHFPHNEIYRVGQARQKLRKLVRFVMADSCFINESNEERSVFRNPQGTNLR